MWQALAAKFAIKKIREFIARKAKASVGSATMGVAGGIIALAAWAQTHPEIVESIAGEWAGVVLAAIAFAAAIARLRTLGRNDGTDNAKPDDSK